MELALSEGERLWAQATRDEVERLALDEGAEIYVRPSRMQTFGAGAA